MTDESGVNDWPAPGETTVTRTHRWRGLSAFGFFAAAGAVFLRAPSLLLVSALVVGLLAYAKFVPAPAADVTIERAVDDTDTAPGEQAQVTLTIHNTSGEFIPQVRVVDGVPPGVAVADGSAQFGTTLRPGRTARYRYTITVPGGDYEYSPVYVATRDLVGAVERRTRIPAVDETSVCGTPVQESALDVPVRDQLTRLVGQAASDERGDGLAFEAVREYQRGDPRSRIDWNRAAKTGELSTIEMQSERSASTVLVIDTRSAAAAAPQPSGPNTIAWSVEAAVAVFDTLHADGHAVGLAALGPDPAWLSPGRGSGHREQALTLLTEDDAFTLHEGADEVDPEPWLRDRLPPNTQVVAFTPACDEESTALLRRLDATGPDVTVVSPDPTAEQTTGQQLAALERQARLRDLRALGIPVLDQPVETSMTAARSASGWTT